MKPKHHKLQSLNLSPSKLQISAMPTGVTPQNESQDLLNKSQQRLSIQVSLTNLTTPLRHKEAKTGFQSALNISSQNKGL